MSPFNEQDPLESFLRKSLRDFSDSPPEDTWDGIYRQLPQTSPIPNFFHRNKWLIFTTLFFIGVIGFQSYFFKKEINLLTEKIETISTTANEESQNYQNNQETKSADLNTSEISKNTNSIQSKNKLSNSSESNSFTNFELINSSTSLTKKEEMSSQLKNITKQTMTTTNSSVLNTNKKTKTTQQLITAIPSKKIHITSDIYNSLDLKKSALNNAINNPTALSSLSVLTDERAASSFTKNDTPSEVNYSNLALISLNSSFPNSKIAIPELSLNYPISNALETEIPDIPNGKWSIGLYGNTVRNWSSITSVKNGNGNNNDDEIKLNVPLIIGQSYGGGIQLQRHFSRKWSLLFGLEYRDFQYRNSFETILKFEDRAGGSSGNSEPVEPPPPLETEFNFTYQLNTALGSTEISFDTEREMDSTNEIDDDESINNKASIRHQIQSFAVPILVQRSWKGRKPIYLSAKGGLIVNWIKDYKLSLESFEVNSDIMFLQKAPVIERNSENNNGQQTNLSLDYSVGIGVHYDFNSRIGVSLEPRFTGSLLPLLRDGFIRGNQVGLGLGGLVYYNF